MDTELRVIYYFFIVDLWKAVGSTNFQDIRPDHINEEVGEIVDDMIVRLYQCTKDITTVKNIFMAVGGAPLSLNTVRKAMTELGKLAVRQWIAEVRNNKRYATLCLTAATNANYVPLRGAIYGF